MAHKIREININDVEKITGLLSKLHNESEFMLYSPGEYAPSMNDAISNLEHIITSKTDTILVAETPSNELIGYITLITRKLERVLHVTRIYMGVLKAFQNKGIGLHLINECEAWCKANNLTRIELTVVKENTPAIQLYERAGYEVEGELRQSLKINGTFHNELVMSKIL
ncbi:GNAT family N-acetyltransferase [Staphylococcus massiliensis]|uniref:GNAT family acetyltransferase n=1 Tax=Staphylococcus massiliensis S46 TaxID=1229783 RepID=K9B489_9STAP|nr:GNAT family N-acetyltransferase [Staphylococcus massiliensis]EKU48615.1 GNAT family acetyltransferase [Staphylococcus massiliensis S46]MCG3400260.1 GNAT family N-acetyltransferase [Staphylococcus massiliensis]MCG3401890.1 GNAT family N-acetyltransferase [Staphylococcus massiliensis]MCG3413144.1 GNAT family N-acetyltransferase [Staphylococcus massiliensis]PNZ98444.1 N-acetyltransferase [Staphylococcus massiliensis CCUG 55927]